MRFAPLIAGLMVGLACLAGAAHAQSLGPQHVKALLAAETRGATPGSTIYVALEQKIDPTWHTYWRNPGDAGQATKIAWTLPAGWQAGDIVWPAPERLRLGPLMDYGYRNEVLLPVPIEVPADAKPGAIAHLSAAVSFLVCADVCVPQDSVVTIDLPVIAGITPADPVWGARIARTLADAPKPSGFSATFDQVSGKLRIAVSSASLAGRVTSDAYFYPFDAGVIDQSAPQAIDLGPSGVVFTVARPQSLQPSPAPEQIQGVIETGDGLAVEVTARPGPPPAGALGLGPPKAASGPTQASAPGLLSAMGLAFLGGLILNLMPCVLPVLSMKAAAFAGHAGEAAGARAQGLAFAAGVMATFLTLAGLLLGARAAGQAVGWGFQLQSVQITGLLALVVLAAALNLSGLYEIGSSLQAFGGKLASRGGVIGAGFTGALAVVVAAPCTAPFMGPALGFALTQPAVVSLLVFAALAAGFALPFTALAFSPPLIRLMPRPGAWMTALRQALAFPMYGTAAWLAWVVAQQAGQDGLARILAAALAVALAAWLWGEAQQRMATGKRAWLIVGPAGLVLAFGVFAVAGARQANPHAVGSQAAAGAEVPSEPYSPERLAALRAVGKPVLVNFTAAWCLTCQVNERTALTAPETAQAFRRADAVYMVGDWTNRDAIIEQALAAQGRVGVPLYLVYGAAGGPPRVLPQLLTSGLVSQALDAAAVRPAAAGAP